MTDLTKISVKARNFKCFGSEEQGFEKILPVNLIIGRNNTGKSALLDIIQYASSQQEYSRFGHKTNPPILMLSAFPNPSNLLQAQNSIRNGSWATLTEQPNIIAANMTQVRVVFPREDQPKEFPAYLEPPFEAFFHNKDAYENVVDFLNRGINKPFERYVFRRLSPDRDVLPEKDSGGFNGLAVNGRFATNLFHQFINKDHLPSDLVEKTLLKELNSIFEPEGHFTRINLQQSGNDEWELYLEETNKGRIRVADSGHGVKTVLLVLAYLYLIPEIEKKSLSNYLFGFEELENNMHPSLQRRLLTYLHEKAKTEHCHFFLTTHSHVAIDIFATSPDAQILHVTHNGEYATVQLVTHYLQHRNILDDLDVRASDLLQSNCIVWVEGPSDRLYFNKWVEIFSKAELKEGVHYQCVFYGGRLLSQLQAKSPAPLISNQDANDLINLMSINKHAILLMDSDRARLGAPVNATKKRIQQEIIEMHGIAWLTMGREIENYIPQEALKQRFSNYSLAPLGQYDDIKNFLDANVRDKPKRRSKNNPTSLPTGFGSSFEKDKVGFARSICEYLTKENLSQHLDIERQMKQVCDLIRKWNKVREGS